MLGDDDGSSDIPILELYLSGRDIACPRCGYNLRNLKSNLCPECGEAVELHVGLTNPRMGFYIALLAACLVGLGGSVLFGMLALSAAPRIWWVTKSAILLLLQLAITGILTPVILKSRSRFRRLSREHQKGLALGMWCLVIGLSAAIVSLFK